MSRGARNMFVNGFEERRDLEQYFWTQDTIHRFQIALQFQQDACCLCVPSLAHSYHVLATENEEPSQEKFLLDIDTRFDYLPLFRYFDLLLPHMTVIDSKFKIVVFDPPFFYIPLEVLYKAVLYVTGGNANAKLLIGFLKREEVPLLKVFKAFQLKPTSFQLQYTHVKPNKWINYCLYSNIDLPGIKRRK
ncbi:hypothetical protein BC833DRAFT_624169 [Globomyces pollinis-pini]|nr:hypothetical protein BC833DRAFT_624169 [Globomyces pollinis-pini]